MFCCEYSVGAEVLQTKKLDNLQPQGFAHSEGDIEENSLNRLYYSYPHGLLSPIAHDRINSHPTELKNAQTHYGAGVSACDTEGKQEEDRTWSWHLNILYLTL